MIETKRLKIHVASYKEMVDFISAQTLDELKTAYLEMLNGSIANPTQWEWYAIWMIELKDGTHIGELCFKGLSEDGIAEIGYGIESDYQNCGYATEAVSALCNWALTQSKVTCIKAEVEKNNIASMKVLGKVGFLKTDETGEEGAIFIYRV